MKNYYWILIVILSAATACLKPAPPQTDAGFADAATVVKRSLNAPCAVDRDCQSSRCLVDCDGQGYCSTTCTGSPDCQSDDNTLCCGSAGLCERVSSGTCGDGMGAAGTSCAGSGSSACQDGMICLNRCQAGATCSTECGVDDDCVAVGSTFACLRTAGGNMRCVEDPDLRDACVSDADCGTATTGSTCQLAVSWRGTHTVTVCAPVSRFVAPGGGGLGDTCIYPNDNTAYYDTCLSNFCWLASSGGDDTCGAFCQVDADCACPNLAAGQCQYICVDESFTAVQGGEARMHKACKRGQRGEDAGVEDGG